MPKDITIRAKWIQFCKLDENDDFSKVYICSNHFTPNDYIEPRAKEFGSHHLRLKSAAVPSNVLPGLKVEPLPVFPNLPEEQLNLNVSLEVVPPQEVHPLTPVSFNLLQVQQEATVSSQTEPLIATKKRPRGLRYAGDVTTENLTSPKQLKYCFELTERKIKEQAGKIRALRQQNRRLTKCVRDLKGLVQHLKNQNLISETCAHSLETDLPESVKDLIGRQLRKQSRSKFSPQLRKFALTLQFYSASAYNYVRRVWKKLLPNPSTIRKWYSVIDGKPGFSREAFAAIKSKSRISSVHINIVIDEMSIRSQVLYNKTKFYGGIDLGNQLSKDNDNMLMATKALVFLAVSLNGHWKVPLGYFLIDSLNGSERANLLVKCMDLLHKADAKVFSITFDGAPVNLSMCTNLGAKFDYINLSPFFTNPLTQKKMYIFWDPCDMLKLVRNTLGDKGMLIDGEGNIIKWEHLTKLLELQQNEGLHAGTKITKKHVYYKENRMNVKLAAQVLSQRVHDALTFVNTLGIAGFEGCMGTAKFCLVFNHIFDLLNCRNKFSKRNKFNIPIEDQSSVNLKMSAKEFENYIVGLKDVTGIPILQTNRKTGFLGFIICLRNIFHLYDDVKKMGQEYLLSFKVSQDPIETFFSAIRSRGGFNNNPNALQFESAYKRLLVKHEIMSSGDANCLTDGIDILYVSSQNKNLHDPIVDEDFVEYGLFDHDYLNSLWTLSPYVENVIEYVSGFIVKKNLNMKSICPICADILKQRNSNEAPRLIEIKNRAQLIFPSKDVIEICLTAERVFRQNYSNLFVNKKIKQVLTLKITKSLNAPFSGSEMQHHILSQDVINNHRNLLIKLIIETFLNIRLFHEAKERSQKDQNIRQKYTKLILFKNQ